MTDTSIKLVKENVTPVQAIEYYTRQQPKRCRYLCPFHRDNNPSLTVKGGHWQCWSCGAHGDVIKFVQMYCNCSFPEAVHRLADDFNIMLPESKPPADVLDKLNRIIEADIREHNRDQIQTYKQSILNEINAMTIIHRAMIRSGAPDKACKAYSAEIDELEKYYTSI